MKLLATIQGWPTRTLLIIASLPAAASFIMIAVTAVVRSATANLRHGLFPWVTVGAETKWIPTASESKWIAIVTEPKVTYLAGYAIIVALLWGAAALYLWHRRSATGPTARPTAPVAANELAVGGALAGLLSVTLVPSGRLYVALAALALAGTLLFASAALLWWSGRTGSIPGKPYRIAAWAVAVFGLAPLVWAIVLTPFHVPNEFLALPETTVLPSGKQIDNIAYINDRKIEGLYIPDRRIPDRTPPKLVFPLGPEVSEQLPIISAFVEAYPERFYFDAARRTMEVHGYIEEPHYRFLLPLLANDSERKRLTERVAADAVYLARLKSQRYSDEEGAFLRLNRAELERQLVLGRYFYHHMYLFSPALARAYLGADAPASQYGVGFTSVLAAVIKAVPQSAQFNAYLVSLYSSYFLYAALVLLVAYLVQIRGWSLAFVGAFVLGSTLLSEIETVRLGVGLAPWRHMFDVVALWLLYRYYSRDDRVAGIGAVLLSGFAIYWSREMGLFLSLAITFALLVSAVVKQRRADWYWIAAMVTVAGAAWRLGDPRTHVDSLATLYGVNTPTLPPGFVTLLALAIMIGIGIWLLVQPPKEARDNWRLTADWLLVGSIAAYTAVNGVYLLWYPRAHHLAPFLPTIGIALVLVYRLFLARQQRTVAPVGPVLTMMIFGLVAALGLARLAEVATERKIFATHVNYQWDFPHGRMTSTGNPELLHEAVQLLRTHEAEVAVNILSPWEVVLLPMAGKAKSGPLLVTYASLLNEAQAQQVARDFLTAKSPVLFVDTAIMDGDYEWPLAEGSLMEFDRGYASYLRSQSHAWLRPVFEQIRSCYVLQVRGSLLSVYRRKDDSPKALEACQRGIANIGSVSVPHGKP